MKKILIHEIHPNKVTYRDRTKKASQWDAFSWWREMDSNHRSETQQIYSLPPLATREPLHIQFRLSSLRRLE